LDPHISEQIITLVKEGKQLEGFIALQMAAIITYIFYGAVSAHWEQPTKEHRNNIKPEKSQFCSKRQGHKH
jgi:hypothetical protein